MPTKMVIRIEFPLSDAMLVVLENLSSLAMNDEVPFLEGEVQTQESEEKAAELRALAKAYREFHDVVTKAIYPKESQRCEKSSST
jgi:hypothetical protein